MVKTILATASLIILSSLGLAQITPTQVRIDSFSQIWTSRSNPDSTRFQALTKSVAQYATQFPDSVLSWSQYHYTLAEQKNSKREMRQALENKAYAFILLGRYDRAMFEMQKVVDLALEIQDSVLLAATYNNIGTIYYYQSKYQEAIRSYSLSLAIHEEKKLEFQQAEILNNMGLIYFDINNPELAMEYLMRALTLYQKLGIQDKSGNIWLNIGVVHSKNGAYQQAITYGQKALPILQATNQLVSVGDCYFLFGQAYQGMTQFDSAMFYVQKSVGIFQDIGNERQALSALAMLAELVLLTDVREATRMGEEILAATRNIPDNTLKKNAFHLLYNCYKRQKKYSLALRMHEQYSAYYDSVLIEENNIKVIREAVQTEYETKLVKHQLENEKINAALKLAQLKKIYSIILVSIVLIFLLLFYTRSRVISHRKQREGLLLEIDRLKVSGNSSIALQANSFQLDRRKLENATDRKINETDWKVLNILLADPVISNKEIAEQAFMTVDGIGSSLRKMYSAFEIKESKYKKISLLMEAIKLSNNRQ